LGERGAELDAESTISKSEEVVAEKEQGCKKKGNDDGRAKLKEREQTTHSLQKIKLARRTKKGTAREVIKEKMTRS